MEGQVAKFEALVGGIPFPDVKWSKDGVALKQNDSIFFETKDGGVSCSLKKCNRVDSGTYQLKCSNASGSIDTQARLMVHGRLSSGMCVRTPPIYIPYLSIIIQHLFISYLIVSYSELNDVMFHR